MPRRLVLLSLSGLLAACVLPQPAPERDDPRDAELAALRVAVAELQARIAAAQPLAEPAPPEPVRQQEPTQVVPLAQLEDLLGALAARREVLPPAAAAPRYQVAGAGEAGWRTVLDTASGVVFNYRQDESGRMRWVAITPPLHAEK